MSEGDHDVVAFAVLVLATLLVIVAAVVALLRSRRIPGLPATSSRAVEEVAALVRMNGVAAMLRGAVGLGRSMGSRALVRSPPGRATCPGRPRLA